MSPRSLVIVTTIVSVLVAHGPVQALPTTKPSLLNLIQFLEDNRTGTVTLTQLTRHRDPDIRGFALLALGRNEVKTSRPTIEVGLRDSVAGVRRMAAFALGQLGDPRAVPALLAAIGREQTRRVRHTLWGALSRLAKPKDLGDVGRFLNGRDPRPTLEAAGLVYARAKRKIADRPWLKRALASADDRRVSGALYALARNRAHAIPLSVLRQAVGILGRDDGGAWEDAIRVLARGVGPLAKPVARLVRGDSLHGHPRAALARGLLKGTKAKRTALIIKTLGKLLRQLRLHKAWLTDAIHPALVLAEGLAGRKLNAQAKGTLKWMLRVPLGSKIPDGLSKSAKKRVARLRCMLSAALGVLSHCDLRTKLSLARKVAPVSVLEPYLKHRSAMARMAALQGVARDVKVLTAALPAALADTDPPVVATAAALALRKRITSKVVLEALDTAWKRLRASRDPEVLIDVLRAMDGLKSPGTPAALREAAAFRNLAIRREAQKRLRKRGLKLPPVPVGPKPTPEALTAFRRTHPAPPHRVRVDTEIGSFTWAFFPHWAPRTSAAIAALVKKGFYRGLSFHRVVPNFVVQGGDPRGDGWGGPGRTMRCENNPVPYAVGVVGMALAGKDTGGSQFFITLARQPHLVGTYTAFGKVIRGLSVVRALVQGDAIRKITVIAP